MIKRNVVAGFALVASLAATSAARADTLASALTSAYNNSGLLEQNRALLRAADEDVAQSVAALRPVISWALSAERDFIGTATTDVVATNSATLSVSASLTVYDNGVNQLAVDAQKEIVLSTRQTLESIEQSVLLDGVEAYMSVVRDREFVELRESNVRVLTEEFRAAQDRFEVGEVTRTDVALAEAQLAAARSLLAAAQGALVQSIELFRVAIGRAPGAVGAVSPAPVSQSVSEAKAFAVRNNPSVLEGQHAVAAAEINIRRAELSLRPTLTLDGFVARDNDANDSAQIGLNLGSTIYAGGQISSQIRQLRANRDASRAGLHLTQLSVEQSVGNAFASLQVARASLDASEQEVRAARVAFEGVREEATLGSRTTLDVLSAEQELLDAEVNRISAQADEVIASYTVLSAMGLLTADHLNLQVQQYDPTAYYNLAKEAPSYDSEQGEALDRILEALGKE